MRSNDPNFIHSKEERLKEDNDELKKEVSYWRSKTHQKRGELKVEGDYNIDDDTSLVSLAKSVLPGIVDLFPPDTQVKLKGLISNPDLIDLAHEFYKSDPAGIKNLLSTFIKNSKAGNNQTPALEEQNFKSGGA